MSTVRKNISTIHHHHSPGGAMGFGRVTYRPGGTCGPRRQRNYQLVVIHRGNLCVSIDGNEKTLNPGEGILLEPGREEYFRFNETKETTHTWCQLPPEVLPTSLPFSAAVLGRVAPCGKWLLGFMNQGWRVPVNLRTPEGHRALLGSVLCAMGQFGDTLSPPELAAKPLPPSLAKVRATMEKHLNAALSLGQLAHQAAVSKGHLIKLAREQWSMTPMQYLWKLRLEESAHLLRETGWNISEIAYRTGFANPFHFSRRFRQCYGRSPRNWRRDAWGSAKKSR